MEIKIKTIELLNGLKKIAGVTAVKSFQPILNNVLIETLEGEIKLTGTNLDMRIETLVPCEVITEGKITLPAQKLTQIIGTFDREVNIAVDGEFRAKISEGKSFLEIPGIAADQYPDIQQVNPKDFISLHSGVLIKGLQKTIASAQTGDNNTVLSGVNVKTAKKGIEFWGCDGNRLTKYTSEIESEYNWNITIPAAAVKEILKIAGQNQEVKLYVEKTRIKVGLGSTVLYSTLMSESYPVLEPLLPTGQTNILTISKDTFLSVIKKVQTITELKKTVLATVFSFSKNKVEVSYESADGKFKETLIIAYTGENIEIGFDDTLLLSGIKEFDAENIEMKLVDSKTGCIFEEENHVYLVMPINKG